MKDYVHGHCSFDFSKGITEYANGSKIVIEGFRELFELAANPDDPRLELKVENSLADKITQ